MKICIKFFSIPFFCFIFLVNGCDDSIDLQCYKLVREVFPNPANRIDTITIVLEDICGGSDFDSIDDIKAYLKISHFLSEELEVTGAWKFDTTYGNFFTNDKIDSIKMIGPNPLIQCNLQGTNLPEGEVIVFLKNVEFKNNYILKIY
jgi:hypothetical protein